MPALPAAQVGAEPVYPMRLSRPAQTPRSLGLYVLAGHRMEPASRIGGERPRVTYAGRVNAASGPLTEVTAGTPYLTAIGQEFPHPESISADHVLRRAPTEDPFQQDQPRGPAEGGGGDPGVAADDRGRAHGGDRGRVGVPRTPFTAAGRRLYSLAPLLSRSN
ncbi:DUF2330 domain-containing protein [Streptomyces sp. P17]|uniref:DUF2330 domain-containing protein n=1 Tax=Streptomyces sp. P17 TaxID=3074716 RepID=UPI0028F3E4B2|nr:DUF2330 domain-containing protein [Streptomyces sp. P17]MDT9698496.1 DUF2330 domain-containing protein [Streptomyces sp. P17]